MTKRAIEAVALKLNIPYLLHFTRAAHLRSIMKHGLYPIGRVNEIGAAPVVNDKLRLDGHRDGTSVSIAFPNSSMFYKYRMADENKNVDWTVLVLDPAVLWTKECAFCRHNAADARISTQPLALLKTSKAFSDMFEELPAGTSRSEQNLKPFDPTDVQAEVLVLDTLPPACILGAIFQSPAVRDAQGPHLGERKTYVHARDRGMFASRSYVRKFQ